MRHYIRYFGMAPALRCARRLRGEAPKIEAGQITRFRAPNQETYFGYYDVSPLSADGEVILAHTVSPTVREPGPRDAARVGYFRRSDPETFHVLDETRSWSWQMAARLRWFPDPASDCVIYNRPVDDRYGAVVRDLDGREVKQIPHAMYDIAPDGRWGLSVNFSRLHRLRPGYGYATFPDPTHKDPAPSEDGIWRIDIESGKCDLIASVDQIASIDPEPSMGKAWHYFNHASISPDGSRFMFFHIWVDGSSGPNRWDGRVFTCDADGGNLVPVRHTGLPSHYCWQGAERFVIFYQDPATFRGEYAAFHVRDGYRGPLAAGLPDSDGHQTLSPDGTSLLTDTYPGHFVEQELLLFGPGGTKRVLGLFRPSARYKGDRRCDLHPRWAPSGREVLFDSTHEGMRAIYLMVI